ncbi:hypothetical protein ACFFRR_003039 [Megaselia abdita]
MTEAIELYHCSSAAYILLKRKGYPLPAISTITAWKEWQQENTQKKGVSSTAKAVDLTLDDDEELSPSSLDPEQSEEQCDLQESIELEPAPKIVYEDIVIEDSSDSSDIIIQEDDIGGETMDGYYEQAFKEESPEDIS